MGDPTPFSEYPVSHVSIMLASLWRLSGSAFSIEGSRFLTEDPHFSKQLAVHMQAIERSTVFLFSLLDCSLPGQQRRGLRYLGAGRSYLIIFHVTPVEAGQVLRERQTSCTGLTRCCSTRNVTQVGVAHLAYCLPHQHAGCEEGLENPIMNTSKRAI